MYTAFEIIKIFRHCKTIEEVMYACECFIAIANDDHQSNKNLINKCSLLKIQELS